MMTEDELENALKEIWEWYVAIPEVQVIRNQYHWEKVQQKIIEGWLYLDDEFV